MNASIPQDENPLLQFCALEYRPRTSEIPAPQFTGVILLVLRDDNGSLRFLVHPELSTIILGADSDYLQSLFHDFIERAKENPDDLFKQLCSLGVGSLVAKIVGLSISDHPDLSELQTRFVRVK